MWRDGDEVARAGTLVVSTPALVPLARLGLWVLEHLREHATDLDGGDLQDAAERLGVIAPGPATKPDCGPGCTCAEYEADICYRDTPATITAKAALADPQWAGDVKVEDVADARRWRMLAPCAIVVAGEHGPYVDLPWDKLPPGFVREADVVDESGVERAALPSITDLVDRQLTEAQS